jgi:hypothetical protein
MSQNESKMKNRALMPNVVPLVESHMKEFGEGKVLWCKDYVTGVEKGKKDQEGFPSKY